MSTLAEQLCPLFLVGTRGQSASVALAAPLNDVLPDNDAPPEARLLRAAGAVALHELAGFVPAELERTDQPVAPADVLPVCSPAAASVLGEVLATNEKALVAEWLDLAAAVGVRAPHGAIPQLLEQARRDRSLRPKVDRAIDHRGRWLADMNPVWRIVASPAADLEEAWSSGSRDQRLFALTERRRQDPAAGRAMVASSWDQDAAADRAAFVAVLAEGLSEEDEPFLEGLLDDRSKQVRAAAVDLLARLPQSRLVMRAMEWLDDLVQHDAKWRKIVVVLPKALDPAMERDGLTEKPPQRQGKRQWWLQQLFARVPPAHWLTRSGLSAKQFIGRLGPESKSAVVAGLAEATSRHPHPDFAAELAADDAARTWLTPEAFAAIPEDRRAAIAEKLDPASAGPLLRAWVPLPPDLSRKAIEFARRHHFASPELICALAPETLAEAEAAVESSRNYAYGVDRLQRLIAVRRELYRAFREQGERT